MGSASVVYYIFFDRPRHPISFIQSGHTGSTISVSCRKQKCSLFVYPTCFHSQSTSDSAIPANRNLGTVPSIAMATAVTSTLSPTQSTYSYGTYTAIPTDTNLCTLETCPISLANFTYLPTVPGNIVYLVIFALILFAQIFFGVRHKTWSFLGGMFGGLVLEVLGYVGRVLDHYSPFNFNWFLL